MTTASLDLKSTQMPMPGMPVEPVVRRPLSAASLEPGEVVQYHGRIRGGPRFGLYGAVVEARVRQAVVDMGAHGRWHIPYYLLTVPQVTHGGRDAVQAA